MPVDKPHIAVIDDEDSMLKAYRVIVAGSYTPHLFSDPISAINNLESINCSAAVLDMKMPGMDGLDVLRKIKEIDPDLQVVIVTALGDVKRAVEAMRCGAFDYITKPFENDALMAILSKAVEMRNVLKENKVLKQSLDHSSKSFIGKSSLMQEVYKMIEKVASVDSTVLVTGESGTGKELAANAIHKASPRKNAPFIVINCAAIPETIMESELFGHERGSFTGAVERKEGKFELADRGTIFLDEIGCMGQRLQSKLLRVLQDGMFERLGGSVQLKSDVRIIAATNAPLEELIAKGEFRQDLYYRLNVVRIHIPPLRQRKEDIPLLLDYFLKHYNQKFNKKITHYEEAAMELMSNYDWPGNVRELKNIVERLVVLSNSNTIPEGEIILGNAERSAAPPGTGLKEAVNNLEKNLLINALSKTSGNQSKAADLLHIHRTTLIEKMKMHGISAAGL